MDIEERFREIGWKRLPKIGEIIKCMDAGSHDGITSGRLYKIVARKDGSVYTLSDYNDLYVSIIENSGEVGHGYYASRFAQLFDECGLCKYSCRKKRCDFYEE